MKLLRLWYCPLFLVWMTHKNSKWGLWLHHIGPCEPIFVWVWNLCNGQGSKWDSLFGLFTWHFAGSRCTYSWLWFSASCLVSFGQHISPNKHPRHPPGLKARYSVRRFPGEVRTYSMWLLRSYGSYFESACNRKYSERANVNPSPPFNTQLWIPVSTVISFIALKNNLFRMYSSHQAMQTMQISILCSLYIWLSRNWQKHTRNTQRLCVNILHRYLFSVSPQLNKYIVFIVLYSDILEFLFLATEVTLT